MPTYICSFEKPEGVRRFFLWSTFVDAPVSYACSIAELEDYYRDMYGQAGMGALPARIERAISKGTSSFIDESLHDLVRGNRAGPDETELTYDELIEYIMNPPTETK